MRSSPLRSRADHRWPSRRAFTLVVALLLGASLPAQAGPIDLAVDLGARAIPFGSSAAGEVGWNQLLWGEKKGPGSYEYGFLRAAARVSGSGFVNRGDASLTIAPVAPLAIDLGGTARLRFIDRYSTVECTNLQCRGAVTGTWGRIRTVAGFGPVFLVGASTWENLTPERPTEGFVDEQSSQIGGDPAHASKGDIRREEFLLLGFKLNPDWSFGWLHQNAAMLRSGNQQAQDSGFVRWALTPNWTILGGAGVYSSSTYEQGPTAFLRASWNDLQSLELN